MGERGGVSRQSWSGDADKDMYGRCAVWYTGRRWMDEWDRDGRSLGMIIIIIIMVVDVGAY